jgi:hypothetical protein
VEYRSGVFISCGQKTENEKRCRCALRDWFKNEGYRPFLAGEDPSLAEIDDVILKELEAADYFVFVDFPREEIEPGECPVSLFSHQELAVAHYLGFKEHVILLRHPNVRRQGFLKSIGDPVNMPAGCFEDPERLVQAVAGLVHKNWTKGFSRHLVPDAGRIQPARVPYRDHRWDEWCYTWQVTMKNCTLRQTADRVVARLIGVQSVGNGKQVDYRDWTWLKWAGMLECYETMIVPGEQMGFDAFAVPAELEDGEPTSRLIGQVRLHSRADIVIPDILDGRGPGEYWLTYRVESLNFPRCEVRVRLVLGGDVDTTSAEIEA